MRLRSQYFTSSIAALLTILLTAWNLTFAQNGTSSNDAYRRGGSDKSYSSRTHSIDERDSRAEQEAERLVSLPAETIIVLLRREPGLFLQVKKVLVRRAYQEGRVLDPRELTDDMLFRLIRQDENIRVLITNEIEDRNYVRAKPSREEMERDRQRRAFGTKASNESTASDSYGASQEDEYWSHQQRQLRQGQPQTNSPLPQSPPADDARRRLMQAQGLESDGPPIDGIGSGMPQISPDQLGQLLSANNQTSTSTKLKPEDEGSLSAISLTQTGGAGPGTGSNFDSASELLPNLAASNDPPPAQQPRVSTVPPPAVPASRGSDRVDQPMLAHHSNPYADVPSLYDLYSQYARHSPALSRFGADVFENGTGNTDQLPMDLPVGPDYVLGPGDGLNIDLWGSFSQRLRRSVDHEGRLALPEVGSLQVSGRTLGDVQHLVQAALRSQFRQIEADVSLSRLRTVRVYVVGDVRRPGGYDVSSLSTALNALYQAGGPTSRGSLRTLKHFRGKNLVETVDVYDLLLRGIHSGTGRLQSGDSLLVPPIAAEVTVQGMVRRPAIYELNNEKNLAEVLELAGGVLPSGTLREVDVERVQAHEARTMLRVDIPANNNEEAVTKALEDFQVQDSDIIKISPILPFTEKTVYLDGHVFRPGKYAFREGMKVSDLIKSYNDLQPEAYGRHAEIIRLKAPNNEPEVLAFNLDDALQGKQQDLALKPFDTVRVFGRFDFEEAPIVTVTGEVRDPGDHVTNGATYIRDAVYLAGNTTPDAELDDAQVFRRTEDGKLKVISVNLRRALDGDARENLLLQPTDRIFIQKSVSRIDPPTVTIAGEVARPGVYPLGNDMSASDLVRLSGGMKRSAYAQEADLTRYEVEQGSRVASEHQNIHIDQALAGQPDTDVRLRAGDVLTIRQISGWNDIGATISIRGEVAHPGAFGIQQGERLSDVLARAGGFSSDAYPYGAILQREQVRELEEKHRVELISEVQQQEPTLRIAPEAMGQWRTTLESLQATSATGRLVIHISADVKRWANTPADIPVRAGDVLFIPKHPNFVLVDGAVYNANAISYKPGRSAAWYLSQAGGPTTAADKKNVFVIRADGSVAGGKGGLFTGGALDSVLQPGDMVMVPKKAVGGGIKWREMLQVAQFLSSIGTPIAVAKGL